VLRSPRGICDSLCAWRLSYDVVVRTFPRQLAAFRRIVNARGDSLRSLPFEELESLKTTPVEDLTIDGRRATIETIVETVEADRLRVVLQGSMPSRFVPGMKHVALDGFYKSRDGVVARMRDAEFYDYS